MTLSSPESSALVWAKDSNAYVCSTVMPDGYTVLEDEDLSGAYYKKAIPVIELQLAKAGYRLAAWLNLIATGEKGLWNLDGFAFELDSWVNEWMNREERFGGINICS